MKKHPKKYIFIEDYNIEGFDMQGNKENLLIPKGTVVENLHPAAGPINGEAYIEYNNIDLSVSLIFLEPYEE